MTTKTCQKYSPRAEISPMSKGIYSFSTLNCKEINVKKEF